MEEYKLIRAFVIAALDDSEGVSDEAYSKLSDLAGKVELEDIMSAIRSTEGRWYLPEGHGLV